MVVEDCEMAGMKDRNSVLLNASTGGVACDVQFNNKPTLSYLYSGKKYLSMTNSYHNSNNCRDHMVSGTSVASIGNIVVDP